MKRQNKIKLQRRRRRKIFWLFAAAAVSALVFTEQVALLFVLSTLWICGLLIVVAFSNLEARDSEMEAAAIGKAAEARDLNAGKQPDATARAA